MSNGLPYSFGNGGSTALRTAKIASLSTTDVPLLFWVLIVARSILPSALTTNVTMVVPRPIENVTFLVIAAELVSSLSASTGARSSRSSVVV